MCVFYEWFVDEAENEMEMEIESPATTSDGKAIIGENNNIDDGNHF